MMPITASTRTTGVKYLRRVREQRQAEPEHAERADLVQHADQQHRGARRRLGRGVRQPGVQRPQRRLDRERDEEARGTATSAWSGRCAGRRAWRSRTCPVPSWSPETTYSADQRGEHEQAAEQAVEQELHRGVRALRAAERPDQEVDRDQHGLEEHVEQEDVGGGEDADDHRLEHEDQREVRLDRRAARRRRRSRTRGSRPGRGRRPSRSAPARCRRRRPRSETPNARIHSWVSASWNCGPPASNRVAARTVSTSATSEKPSATCLASRSLPARQQRDDDRADEGHDAERWSATGRRSRQILTRTTATTRTAAPTSMDSAYERAKPVCTRRPRPTGRRPARRGR